MTVEAKNLYGIEIMWLHQTGHFSIKSMKRPESAYMTIQVKQKYTAEFKVVPLTVRMNRAMWEIARALGIKENTLYNWVYQSGRPPEPDKPTRTDE